MRKLLILSIVLAFLCCLLPAQAVPVSGTWVFHVTTDAGTGDPEFTLQQEGNKITGKYKGMLGESDVSGTVDGNEITISFKVSVGGEATIVYKGTIESPDKMKGTVDLAGQASGTWEAERKK